MFLSISKETWQRIKNMKFKDCFMERFFKYSIGFVLFMFIYNTFAIKKFNLQLNWRNYILIDLIIPIVLSAVISISNCYIEKKINEMVFLDKNLRKSKIKLYFILSGAVWAIIILNLVSILTALNLYIKPMQQIFIEIIATLLLGLITGWILSLLSRKKLEDIYKLK